MTDPNDLCSDAGVGADSHPTAHSIGRRRLLQAAGVSAGAATLASAIPAGFASAAVPAGATRFVALPKGVRVADTRFAPGHQFEPGDPSITNQFTRLAPNHIRVQVRQRHGVPASATSVVLTVTGSLIADRTFVTVFPTGRAIPLASNLNLTRPNETNANLVFVRVGDGDSVDVFQKSQCHVIVDVLGYFEPVSAAVSGGRFIPLDPAKRALDTRLRANPWAYAGWFTEVDLTGIVPEGAAAFVNLAALENERRGFFTAVPYSVTTTPTTSSLNIAYAGEMRAASVIVPVETHGGRQLIKIYSHVTAKLLVDVAGYFTPESAKADTVGLFVPTDPFRVLDTRATNPPTRMYPKWVVEQPLPAPSDNWAAVAVNLTSVATHGRGYLTISGARLRSPAEPLTTSNVNWLWPNSTVPNLAISQVTKTYGFEVYNHSGGHVVVDVAGYFTGTPRSARYGSKYVNPPPPPIGPEWTLRVPRLGLTSRVLPGNGVVVTDSGHTWHWTGTGYMGQAAHVGVFGHRTEAGSPYRYVHLMQPGDTWTVTTGDGREFTYRMVRRDLTDAQTPNILDATRFHPGSTFSIIACTRGYDSSGYRRYLQWYEPTSLQYRIIVTGELVGWRQVF